MSTVKPLPVTPAAQAVIDANTRGEDGICCEHLTPTERAMVAWALGWETTPRVLHWIWGDDRLPQDTTNPDTFDYEGAILTRQERETGAL